MPRLEYKYYIPNEFLDDLRHSLSPYIKYDCFTELQPKKEYTVRSTYLDSLNLFTHHEKLDGVKSRKKFRIRGYNSQSDDSLVFLEIKRKEVDSISKDRIALLYRNLEEFLRTNDFSLLNKYQNNFISEKAYAGNILFYYHLYNLKPSVVVSYEREAYECRFGTGLRLTIDKNVRTRRTKYFKDLFDNDRMIPAFKNNFAIEVKFSKILPKWLSSVLVRYNVKRTSVPKYSWSIEAAFNNQFIKDLN